uniref:AAA family n=1 Tax=Mycena chlorophos TaxID=658473 RepID=A0ABQ0L5D4_MYCCL|nr:AAA family [Mycena chlorophos]
MSRNNPDEEDSGATKLWSIYVDEAAKYDKSLVESWRSDMEGILIFAGLFSASLTAFLVESYTNLMPDPTIQLLTQISQQISIMGSNMTIVSQASSSQFQPPKAALICNAFWFISLGLSLASALIATLLEQWTRDFLHRANMRSSPVVRARVYSYLYYGLRRFQLHAVVDLLPALLHGALFFFFDSRVLARQTRFLDALRTSARVTSHIITRNGLLPPASPLKRVLGSSTTAGYRPDKAWLTQDNAANGTFLLLPHRRPFARHRLEFSSSASSSYVPNNLPNALNNGRFTGRPLEYLIALGVELRFFDSAPEHRVATPQKHVYSLGPDEHKLCSESDPILLPISLALLALNFLQAIFASPVSTAKVRHAYKSYVQSTLGERMKISTPSDVEGSTLTLHQPRLNSQELFHCRRPLRKRLEDEKNKHESNPAVISDIGVAMQFIAEDYPDILGAFDIDIRKEISFDLLWALFPPNVLVYRSHIYTEQDQILIARTFEYLDSPGDREQPCAVLECDVVTHDGSLFGFARELIKIPTFSGSRLIQNLSLFPLLWHPRADEITARAMQRGKKIAAMPRWTYHEISGPAMKEGPDRSSPEHKAEKFTTQGRVMIDPTAFRLFQPNCSFNFDVHRALEPESLTDEQYLVCSPVLLGFCFGAKQWGGFAMDRLADVIWSDVAFKSLVLGVKQKKLIHSLVQSHKMHSAKFDDVVEGKGKGLIGLFSGSPGCGKTLTAEAVAEATHRPLYPISAGELGTNPTDVDKQLTMVLQIAQTWDAVLLLDEAEVFLQQRAKGDLARNALVSIFLRQLEYYQGILILTTNLIEQCDPAFESRLHFSIYYPELGVDSRRQIWRTFLGRAMGHAISSIASEDLDRLAKIPLNGRQIKNTVSNAECVAVDAHESFSLEHIDAVLEVMNDWEKAKREALQAAAIASSGAH